MGEKSPDLVQTDFFSNTEQSTENNSPEPELNLALGQISELNLIPAPRSLMFLINQFKLIQ